jgi:glycosyltransferase involved in cell wall biosynthesis
VARAAKQHKVEALWSLPDNAPDHAAMPVILFATDLLSCEPNVITQERASSATLRHYRKVCNNAVAIVSPSEFLRQSYLKLLEIPLNKIVVAPLGVDEGFGQPQRTIAEPPYFLVVGSTSPARNIPRLRDAIARLEPEHRHTLVVVGAPGEDEPSVWEGDVVRVEYCPIPQLAGLYQHCQVCIIPSLYDGTGLTALEALRSGAIIAAARTGAIPEFAGDAPFYFMPNNVTSVTNALRRALDEGPQERTNRGRAARQMVVGYTWESCAWKALSAFHRI